MRLLASSRLFPGNCLTRETWAKTRSIVGLCGGRVAGLACFGAGRAMRRCYRSEIGVYEASDRGCQGGQLAPDLGRRCPAGNAQRWAHEALYGPDRGGQARRARASGAPSGRRFRGRFEGMGHWAANAPG